jgi:UDP-N-acetyl-D-galactosamine dehydrogenase
MGAFFAQKLVKMLVHKDVAVRGARVAVLGLTFKENVPDLRNSRVPDIVAELKSFGVVPLIYDPHADADDARHEYGVELVGIQDLTGLDAAVLAVNHAAFGERGYQALLGGVKHGGVVIDVKSALPRTGVPGLPSLEVWSL